MTQPWDHVVGPCLMLMILIWYDIVFVLCKDVYRILHMQSYIYIYTYICSAMSAPLCASAEPGEAWVQAVLMAHNERRSAHWTPPLATQLHNYTTLEVWGTETQSILRNIENSSLITPYHTLSHLNTPAMRCTWLRAQTHKHGHRRALNCLPSLRRNMTR